MEDLVVKRVQKAIAEKVFPGCAVGWVRKNGEQKIIAHGNFTYEAGSRAVKENSMFDIASITKTIPASFSLLSLIDRGDLNLEDRLVKFVPEFGNFEDKKEVTIKHLLTYTLDLDVPAMSSLKNSTAGEIMDIITKARLKKTVGSRFLYTNSTAFFFGLIIEKVTGKKLDEYADEYFFEPLKMSRTTFHPENFNKEEIVPTEIDEWRGGLLQGVIHDESTFILNKKYISGIAGLFSTVPDLLKFQEMILGGGVRGEIRYLSEGIIKESETNQLADIGACAGLGWEMSDPMRMGRFFKEIIGKSGFTGCMVMINIKKEIALAILSNRVYPKRPDDGGAAINGVRRDLADIIFS